MDEARNGEEKAYCRVDCREATVDVLMAQGRPVAEFQR